VKEPLKIQGVIFSDLGVASKFMGLEWVQQALLDCLGFAPFPATLNVRPARPSDAAVWDAIRDDTRFFCYMPGHEGACRARVYRIAVAPAGWTGGFSRAAVLFPEVEDYPKDKIEIVAPVRLKDAFAVQDGARLTLEFIH
jgi:CTP-dependent riboflavin kinase